MHLDVIHLLVGSLKSVLVHLDVCSDLEFSQYVLVFDRDIVIDELLEVNLSRDVNLAATPDIVNQRTRILWIHPLGLKELMCAIPVNPPIIGNAQIVESLSKSIHLLLIG